MPGGISVLTAVIQLLVLITLFQSLNLALVLGLILYLLVYVAMETKDLMTWKSDFKLGKRR
jgi:hypothetical protein